MILMYRQLMNYCLIMLFVEGSGKGPMGGGDVSLKNIWSKDGFRKMILRTLNWKL